MTTDPTEVLTAAYWDNFANPSRSTREMDWERLDQVESILETGGKPAISLVLQLIATAPRDRDGWLSYLLTGPIDDLWRRSDLDQRALVEASAQSDELAEALSYFTTPTPNEADRVARKAKRPSKRQGKRPKHP